MKQRTEPDARQWWEVQTSVGARPLAKRLAASFGMAAASKVDVERTYLDTFDWLMFRQQQVLVDEQRADSGRVLLLQQRGEGRAELRVPVTGRPNTGSELPASIRHRVGDKVASRSLLVMASERVEVLPLRLLDDEGKTVAAIDVEQAGAQAARVQLVTVRGYERESARLRALLDSQADLRRAPDPMVRATEAAGRHAGEVPRAAPITLDVKATGAATLAAVLQHQLEELTALDDGVRDQLDPELLHDFRIAVRRTRSAVRLARRHLPDGMAETWESEWSWLADVTSRPRDLDVLLEQIEALRGQLPAGVDELVAAVESERTTAQARLSAALDDDRYGTLVRGWRVATGDLASSGPAVVLGAKELAEDVTHRAAKQLVRHAEAVDANSEAELIHDLRKRTKRLRYALDLFGSLLPPSEVKPIVKRSKQLQDDLGQFQDSDVQRKVVAQLLDDRAAMSAGAIDAGHALMRLLDARHDAARGRLGGQIKRFRAALDRV